MTEQKVELHEGMEEENQREYWLQQAIDRGISFPKNIPTEKLKETVKSHIANQDANANRGRVSIGKVAPEVEQMQLAATALVRCQINNLDPSRADWNAMLFTVGNDNITAVKRLVPVDGRVWHVEKIILDHIKSRTYNIFPKKMDKSGRLVSSTVPKKMPMFQVIELPPLTEQELKDLAEQQRQNGTGQTETDM